jgi:hypothetical protein
VAEHHALSLHQPWASAVALGVKTVETRSWSTNYRGPLLIHATSRRPRDIWRHESDEDWPIWIDHIALSGCWQADEGDDGWWRYQFNGPLGALIAMCDLVAVAPVPTAESEAVDWYTTPPGVRDRGWGIAHDSSVEPDDPDWRFYTVDESQRPLGDFTYGRFMWLLDNIEPIEPKPYRGRQRLWRCSL